MTATTHGQPVDWKRPVKQCTISLHTPYMLIHRTKHMNMRLVHFFFFDFSQQSYFTASNRMLCCRFTYFANFLYSAWKELFSALRSYSRTTHSVFALKRRKPNRFMGATQCSHTCIYSNYGWVCCTPAVYTNLQTTQFPTVICHIFCNYR